MSHVALTNWTAKAPASHGRSTSAAFAPKNSRSKRAGPVGIPKRNWSISHLRSTPILQRSATHAFAPTEAPPIVHTVIASPGQPLDKSTRGFFEQRFQHDFRRVRIHVIDLAAEREKRELAAKARARKVVPQRKAPVGENQTSAVYTEDEIAAEHAEATQHTGHGDQLNEGDAGPESIRNTRHIRPGETGLWTGDSALLGRRLGPPPGPGYQAHHIVPAGEPRSAALREFMEKRGWKDINDVDNGVWLPTHNTQGNLGGEFKHEFTFDKDHFDGEYFSRLEEIWITDPRIKPSGLRLKLRNIRSYLRRGMLPPASL